MEPDPGRRPFQPGELWAARHELTACLKLGIPPREWAGEPPADPRWDWADKAIVTAWLALNDRLCPRCGRPLEVHKTDSVDDYHAATITCTAIDALDMIQAEWRKGSGGKADKAARKQGLDPDRARWWITYTDAEGLPT